MSNIIPTNEIQTMAIAIAKSGLFGAKTPDQAMALMLVAQAEGLHPATAARDYHVIQGRPALKADAMMARFQTAGGKVEWSEYTDERVVGVFSHPQGGSVTIDWTIDRAKQAGVYGKNPTWKSYPRSMLRARCISEGIRTVYPGVISGFYTPEEVHDFEQPEKDITPIPTPEKKKENVAKAKEAIKPKPAIESTAKTISGDPEEGALPPMKPLQADIDKMLAAFAKLDMDAEFVGKEYGKPVAEWTMEDMTEAREWYKARKQDFELRQMEINATKVEI